MRKTLLLVTGLIAAGFAFHFASCNNAAEEKKTPDESATKTMSKEDMVKRGDYIVTTGACGDCHSPKIMTPMGPVPDSSKLLSGSPANASFPPINEKSLQPGNWMSMAPDITAFVGPWGVSYTANLTPDSATGIGAWSETTFINTIRSGKHLGNGRDILPPMPWQFLSKMTDDDLKAVYAYLQSLPPINNKVPPPLSPAEAQKRAAGK